MQLEIHALTPQRTNDYLAFFDSVAFADHLDWSWCYCTFYHFDAEVEKELDGCGKEGLRNRAMKLIATGELQGYLAYVDGTVVGWSNVNDKKAFRRLRATPELWEEEQDAMIKSIVCFIVAERYRRQGVATALLERAYEDAKMEGYDYLEAYPLNGEHEGVFVFFNGFQRMYEKAGFTLYKEAGRQNIVRKMLRHREE